MGKRKTIKDVWDWLENNISTFKICEDTVYVGKDEKLKLFCTKCNNICYISWASLRKNIGCGVCHGLQTVESNCLAYLRPDLIDEWIKSKNNKTPYQVTKHSKEMVLWKCKNCTHEWWAEIDSRTGMNSGCPNCAGQVVNDKNRLSLLFSDISQEWHPVLNGDLTPDKVTYGRDKKVWWLCRKCKHEWKSLIKSRTTRNSGCPKCADEQKESKVATQLKKYILENYKSTTEYKIFRNPLTNCFLPFDIYIYSNIFIEIHGEQHYKITGWDKLKAKRNKTTPEYEFQYRQHLDKIKKDFAEQNGLYIEVNLLKIKTVEDAISYIQSIIAMK